MLLKTIADKVRFEFAQTFMFYLPRICEHCLNPSCAASCPSGAIYKRTEDGIVLVDQDRCRGWRMCAITRNDKAMYVLLVGTILLGLGTTVLGNATGHPHDYRQTVAPWFRSIFYLHPRTDLILAAPIGFRLHALAAWTLFVFWPFNRLVHVFSAPIGYLTRPYIVYRSRDPRLGARPVRRGWERVP